MRGGCGGERGEAGREAPKWRTQRARTHSHTHPACTLHFLWCRDVRQSLALRVAAQGKELEAIQREAAEYSEDIKSSVDARRTAEAEKMRLERSKEALISSHSAEVAEMVSSLRRLQTSLGQYNSGIVAGLSAVEGITLKAGV